MFPHFSSSCPLNPFYVALTRSEGDGKEVRIEEDEEEEEEKEEEEDEEDEAEDRDEQVADVAGDLRIEGRCLVPKSSFLNAVDNDNARTGPTAKEKIGSKLRMCIKVRKFVYVGRFRTNGLMKYQHDAV